MEKKMFFFNFLKTMTNYYYYYYYYYYYFKKLVWIKKLILFLITMLYKIIFKLNFIKNE